MKFRLFIAAMILPAIIMAFSVKAMAADIIDPLKNIKGFDMVAVYANPYDKTPDKEKAALSEEVTRKLVQAGLPLMDKAGAEALPGKPRLVVFIGVIPQPFCGSSKLYEVDITFQEEFIRVREPGQAARKETWKLHAGGLSASPEDFGFEMVGHAVYSVDTFIDAFLKANPLPR